MVQSQGKKKKRKKKSTFFIWKLVRIQTNGTRIAGRLAGKHLMKKIQTISQYTQSSQHSSLRAIAVSLFDFLFLSQVFFCGNILCVYISSFTILQFVYPTRLLSPGVPVNQSTIVYILRCLSEHIFSLTIYYNKRASQFHKHTHTHTQSHTAKSRRNFNAHSHPLPVRLYCLFSVDLSLDSPYKDFFFVLFIMLYSEKRTIHRQRK